MHTDMPSDTLIEFKGGDGVVMRFRVQGAARVQPGASLHFTKFRNWTFVKWADGSELPCAAADWLAAQMAPWLKERARNEFGDEFKDRIRQTTRTVLLLDPDPIYKAGADMDRYPEKTRARRSHRALCWSMRRTASEPVDVRELEAGQSALFGLAVRRVSA